MWVGYAHMRRLAMAVVGLLVLGGSAYAGAASGSDLDLRYDVYYSVLRVLRIESRSRVERDAYDVHSTMETVGLTGAIFPWTYRSEVQGRIADGRLAPDRFQSWSEFHGKIQQVELRYEGADPVVDKLQAFKDDVLGKGLTRDDVPPELRAGTIDPLTEITALAHDLADGEGCAGTRHVFDGVRRYDTVYEDLGEQTLKPSRRDAYHGPARVCRSHIRPIAGFWKSKDQRADALTQVTAWLMPVRPGLSPVPVRLEVSGPRGELEIHLGDVSVPQDAPAAE
jgi:Protein of unknown function (DUF3108)